MHSSSAATGPVANANGVGFVLADRSRRLCSVRLAHEIGVADVAFTRLGGQWRLQLPRPPVNRMEYLFDIQDLHGSRTTITDPANPLRAPGAFGEKSVLLFPDYEEPDWLGEPPVDADETTIEVDAPLLGSAVNATLWSPSTLSGPAPLLVVHDGPEYAALGGLTRYLGAGIASARLPALRALLLDPGDRNVWYCADDAYARTLVERVLPAAAKLAPSTSRIGVGVSLGALAMLHAQRTHPGSFAGLLLQSGSFFTPDLDDQESDFSAFAAVSAFVASVHDARAAIDRGPVSMTCGVVEENLANNQRMAATLTRLGHRTRLHLLRDAHNYTAWRDALHPHLTALITSLEASDAA